MAEPYQSDPIENYLKNAKRQLLRRRFPEELTHDALAEAREHLNARAAELIANGIAQGRAESTAVAAFGDAAAWSRSIVDSTYGDRYTQKAATLAIVASAVMICSPLTGLCGEYLSRHGFLLMQLGAVGLAAGSFRARRYFPAAICSCAAVTMVIGFLASGFTQVDAPFAGEVASRAEMQHFAAQEQMMVAYASSDMQLLRLGLRTYNEDGVHLPIPAALMASNGYIVPFPQQERGSSYSFIGPDSSFKSLLKPSDRTAKMTQADLSLAISQEPYRTANSLTAAAAEWRLDGPGYLNMDQQVIDVNGKIAKSAEAAVAEKPGFDWGAGVWELKEIAVYVGLALALHYLAAAFGRMLLLARLRQRKRSPAR